MKKILFSITLIALLFLLQACAEASAEEPNPINVVVEQAGDSARIIAAWTASERGTNPLFYWVRLIHPGGEADPNVLRWSRTTYAVDTLYHPWASETDLFRVGVQAEDSVTGDTTAYVWSDAFQLIEPEPYRPPGSPGTPTVTIDTGDFVVLDSYRSVPQTNPDMPLKIQLGGSAVMEGYWFAGGDLIACRRLLLVHSQDGLTTVVGSGLCDNVTVVPVDRVYDSWMHQFTTPQELTANLVWDVYTRR